jgi:homoserine dehydrogenase
MSASPLRIAIAGLGTVGVGVVKCVQSKTALYAQRCGGRGIEIVAVCSATKGKDRGVDLSS